MTRYSNRRYSNLRASHSHAANDILCYADQGSFLGFRAFDRGPIVHFTWLYSHQPADAEINQFNHRLADGLLGRLVQRSALPWGRHRWVANPTAAPVTWFRNSILQNDLADWRSSLINLPIDPEHGPGWRLAVQSLAGGGCAISLLVSHTIADGEAISVAVAKAISGQSSRCHPPARSTRWLARGLIRDCVESLRSLPDLFNAIGFILRRRRTIVSKTGSQLSRPHSRTPTECKLAVAVPLVQIAMERSDIGRSSALQGVSANTLVVSFTARLASHMGRVNASGRATVVLPVSDRAADDCRGNALRSISLQIDLRTELDKPRHLQAAIRSALASLLRHGDDLSPMFPLIPYVPVRLARSLERLALGQDMPSGCSLLGALPEEVSRPFGDNSLLLVSLLERFTQADLDHRQGQLFILGYMTKRHYMVTVSGYAPGRITTRALLRTLVCDALSEAGLSGEVT